MRAVEFIIEATAPIGTATGFTTYEQLVDYVTQHCGPYLAEVGGIENALSKFSLYRGVAGIVTDARPIVNIPSRQSRKPVDTPGPVQNVIDEWLLDNMGEKFRSKSVFASSDITIVRQYGITCVIIPTGNYTYCWSKRYSDMFVELSEYANKIWNSNPTVYKTISSLFGLVPYTNKEVLKSMSREKEFIDRFMTRGEYVANTGLMNALDNGNEVMIICPSIIAIDIEYLLKLQGRLK